MLLIPFFSRFRFLCTAPYWPLDTIVVGLLATSPEATADARELYLWYCPDPHSAELIADSSSPLLEHSPPQNGMHGLSPY